jgi:hypothetical protein
VAYETFDRAGEEVLRLAFRPAGVVVGARAAPKLDELTGEGYVVRALGDGDFEVRVRHESSREVRIDGT